MSILLEDPGWLVGVEAEALLITAEVILPVGGLENIPNSDILLGTRNLSDTIGIFISNSDTEQVNTGVSLPGFALKKGLRVMTLIDDKIVAFRNIID